MISTVTNQKLYNGNGNTSVFPYDFKIFAEADLEVIIADSDDVQTVLTLNTHYTISGEGEDTGGNVTTNDLTALCGSEHLPTGWVISIRRVVDLLQETDYNNQGGFYPETHEQSFDRLVAITQQLQNELDRCPKVTETSGDTGEDFIATLDQAVVDGLAAIDQAVTDGEADLDAIVTQALIDVNVIKVACELAETNAETAETNAETAQGLAEDARDAAAASAASIDLAFTKIKARRATGAGSQAAFKAVKLSGDYATDEVPAITTITSLDDRVIGFTFEALNDGETDLIITRGRVVITGFDTSASSIGAKVYTDASGNPTLTETDIQIGQVQALAADGVVYINIGGSGSGVGILDGVDKVLGTTTIDGSTNTINTLYSLYAPTSKSSVKNKLVIYNGNSTTVAKVRVAYRDGTIANEDYIIYDLSIGPRSRSVGVEIPVVADGHTMEVLSDTTNVVFTLLGEEITGNSKATREGAIDIDGSTNAINTDKNLVTFSAENEVDVIICNRNASATIKYMIKLYNGSVDITLEEAVLLPNQSGVFSYDLNVANGYSIKVQADTTNVSFACFSRGITGSSLGLDLPADVQLKRAAISSTVLITDDYTWQNAWTNIPGYTYTSIKTAKYRVKAIIQNYFPAAADNVFIRFARNGTQIGQSRAFNPAAATAWLSEEISMDDVLLEVNDVLTVQAYASDLGGKNDYTSGLSELALQVVETSNLVDYVKNPYQIDYYQVNLTVTGTNWTTTRAVGLAYKDPNGVWRLKGNIRGSVSSPTQSITLTIAGVTFKNVSNFYQPVNGNQEDSASKYLSYGYATANTSTIVIAFSGTTSGLGVSFDVELESKPTWI